ncbi:MAG: hypothetical protein VX938_00330 [Myxococcota bacterium]|nr:hypothetical protein [Myxococcota bacterium]
MGAILSAMGQKNLAPEAISQLQRHLAPGSKWGVRPTGTYDLATARSVMDADASTRGVASEGFFEERGLMVFQTGEALVPPDLREILARHKDGLTLSLIANYQSSGNDAEFHRRGNAHAQEYGSVGVSGEGLSLGTPILIDRVEDMPQKILQVVNNIRAAWRDLYLQSAHSMASIGVEFPEWHPCCFVKNLSLFAHGIQTGLSMNQAGSYRSGLHDGRSVQEDGVSSYDLNQGSTVKGFVQSVAGVLAPDVDVQLFACNAGLSPNVEGEDWSRPDPGPQGGEDSFAYHFLEALRAEGMDDSSVFAHITAGHTTENFSARVFGARAEEVNGEGASASLFDLVYTPDYVAAQVTALGNGATVADVRKRMWRVVLREMYRDGAPRGDLGMKLFTDLDRTRTHFQQVWDASLS